LQADFLAESLEVAIGAGLSVLAALRGFNDQGAIEHYKVFDAGARTSRRAAESLRETLSLIYVDREEP
jgi:hypothetical protein